MTVDSLDACSGVREIRYSIDGAARTAPGSTATFTATGDGVHEVAFGATDTAGNSEQVQPTSVKIDTTRPIITASISPLLDEYGAVQPVVGGFNTMILLEAWRKGTDQDGRHYAISAAITDTAGNTSVVTTQAVCPHDMGKEIK
jgi:hypothetical protein